MCMTDSMTANEFVQEIITHFLGDDWYVADPLGQEQVNLIALEEIKSKFPSGRFRRIPKQKRRILHERDRSKRRNRYV